jgi:hypothetical protein
MTIAESNNLLLFITGLKDAADWIEPGPRRKRRPEIQMRGDGEGACYLRT